MNFKRQSFLPLIARWVALQSLIEEKVLEEEEQQSKLALSAANRPQRSKSHQHNNHHGSNHTDNSKITYFMTYDHTFVHGCYYRICT